MPSAHPPNFQSTEADLAYLRTHPHTRHARKKEFLVTVSFVPTAGSVQTLEGLVQMAAGDALVTGQVGERWCVPQAAFDRRYRPAHGQASGQDGRYLSRAVEVSALQMPTPFTVLLSDGLSRLHGQGGDWLVDYRDDQLGVVANEIFLQTYELLA
ncbi:MAG: hypothetical protein JOY60_04325 [Burkholderiaceae bacterium]|nr:hypothetical protein [Roseateles sp.]MBV8469073.1 hypothetical protein [Burkholderiaceae bacterium]